MGYNILSNGFLFIWSSGFGLQAHLDLYAVIFKWVHMLNFSVYNNDEIHSRLLELVDPSKHNHPGIPYDFHGGYILMISDNIDEPETTYGASSYSSSAVAPASTTTLLGRLPEFVISAFQSNYGRYNQVRRG